MTEKKISKYITRLDGEQRFYKVGDKKYPSATTILGVIDKPALTGWKIKMVKEDIDKNWRKLDKMRQKMPLKEALAIITKEAKKNPEKISKEARDIGSEVHGLIERAVEWGIKNKSYDYVKFLKPRIKNSRDEIKNCINAFMKWAIQHNFQPKLNELTVYSHKKKVAGTLDAYGLVDGIPSIIDYKSSKYVYNDYFLQLAIYKHCFLEMFKKDPKIENPKQIWILRLGKEDGDFQAVKVTNYREHLKVFLSVYELWKWQQKYK